MGRNQQTRKRLRGIRRVVAKHEEKLRLELAKAQPDYQTALYWIKEPRARQAEISLLEARLPGRKTR